MSETLIEQISTQIIIPSLLLMFFLGLLFVLVCFLIKKADECDKKVTLEKKRKEEEINRRFVNMELDLEQIKNNIKKGD